MVSQSRNTRFAGQNVVITGGSSGIGLATAVEFAKLGAKLFLIARDEKRLAGAAAHIVKTLGREVPIVTLSANVADRSQIEAVIQNIGQDYGGIHTLIANAGLRQGLRFEDDSLAEIEQSMNVNYWGAVYALKVAWPYLKVAQHGHIGFVSSVAGYVGLIGYSSYAPAKFALTGLAECIRMEAKDYGIGVTIVFPPDTDTPMLKQEREHSLAECLALSKHASVMAPETVATQFVSGIVNYRFEVICNLESRLARLVKAVWPWLHFTIVDGIVARARRTQAKPPTK